MTVEDGSGWDGLVGREPKTWKGVRICDSVQISCLAEEIVNHFGHDCNEAGCGDNEDEETCVYAWVEDKLQDFLTKQASSITQELRPMHAEILIAAEFGYRSCEKGENIEMMREKIKTFRK